MSFWSKTVNGKTKTTLIQLRQELIRISSETQQHDSDALAASNIIAEMELDFKMLRQRAYQGDTACLLVAEMVSENLTKLEEQRLQAMRLRENSLDHYLEVYDRCKEAKQELVERVME
jgi:hypothetical protein